MTVLAYVPYKLRSVSKQKFHFKQGNKRKERVWEDNLNQVLSLCALLIFPIISLKLNGMKHLFDYFISETSTFYNARSKRVGKVWASSTRDLGK